ncbi:extracellular superoxide dismutase [Cu-Zn]-like [Hyperolius riggenbachi]|uniref:extracellular superoxide dismutase [Cu-Zn]-like n=1 Tax=Hyperolius riggenbachi TaxID=752182 RepID=UPI0035A324C0
MITTILILVATISFGAGAEDEQPCQSDQFNDMSQKINELWHTLLNGIPAQSTEEKTVYATCNLQPNPKLNASEIQVTGQLFFKQAYPHGKLDVVLSIEGFPLDANQTARAIHIHDFGDLSSGCDSAGGHYNPHSMNHPQHPGDFGNFRVKNGKLKQHLRNINAYLFGPFSVIGRSIVVHKMADDLGKGGNKASLENGNAGPRLACCVIGTISKNSWDKYMEENQKQNHPKVARHTKRQSRKPK